MEYLFLYYSGYGSCSSQNELSITDEQGNTLQLHEVLINPLIRERNGKPLSILLFADICVVKSDKD